MIIWEGKLQHIMDFDCDQSLLHDVHAGHGGSESSRPLYGRASLTHCQICENVIHVMYCFYSFPHKKGYL